MTQSSRSRQGLLIATVAGVVVIVGVVVLWLLWRTVTLRQLDFRHVEATVESHGKRLVSVPVTINVGGVEMKVVTDAFGHAGVTLSDEKKSDLVEARSLLWSARLTTVPRDFREELLCSATAPNYVLLNLRCNHILSGQLWPPDPARYEPGDEAPFTGQLDLQIELLSKKIEMTNGLATTSFNINEAQSLIRLGAVVLKHGDVSARVSVKLLTLDNRIEISESLFSEDGAALRVQNRTLSCREVHVRAGYKKKGDWDHCIFHNCFADGVVNLQPGDDLPATLTFGVPVDCRIFPQLCSQSSEITSITQKLCPSPGG